ncbi:nephrocystin-3-like [Dysidea avara]|uniref:nephrocystin-3-like n=1 Tax=Dysidea avara TaxID=196820 RepID=UPI00332D83DB
MTDSLIAENKRLRDELKIQEARAKKLKNEKDEVEQKFNEALGEILRLEEELENSKAVMKKYREDKEKEIQQLKLMKQELELRVRATEDDFSDLPSLATQALSVDQAPSATDRDSAWMATGRNEPTLNTADMAEAFSEWEGVEDIVAMFKEETTEIPNWSPEMHVNWSLCLKLYISAPKDMEQAANMFIRNHVDHLKSVCKEGGCTLVPVLLRHDSHSEIMNEDQFLEVCKEVCQNCHIFVALLGSSSTDQTKLEYEHGYLNSFGRPAVFFFHSPQGSLDLSGSGTGRLISRVKKAKKFAKIIETAKSVEEGLQQVASDVESFLHKELKVLNTSDQDMKDDYKLKHIAYIQDMRNELEQDELISTINHFTSAGLFAYDQCFKAMSEHIESDSTTVPLLLVGGPGSGKSTILSKWLDSLLTYPGANNMLVLQHFVSTGGSNTTEPSVIVRRFLHKLKYCHPDFGQLPTSPSEMVECFSHWLTVAASQRLKNAMESNDFSHLIVIAIDNADLVADCGTRLSFLTGSLPVNVKVIFTANEDNYPENWRALTKFFFHTFTSNEALDMTTNILEEAKSTTLNDLQMTSLALSGPSEPSPLWCSMAARHATSVAVGIDESAVDEIIDTIIDLEEITDLTVYILEDLTKRLGELAPQFEKAMQFIYWSRNGIMLSELLSLCDISITMWCYIYHCLHSKHILMEIGGLITFTHNQVMDAHDLHFCCDPEVDHRIVFTNKIVDFFNHTEHTNVLITRKMEEVPCLLKRAERMEDLKTVLLDIDLLIVLHYSGRSSEVMSYWQQLDSGIVNEYYKILRNIENEESPQELLVVASLYTNLGMILSKMNLLSEAMAPLQRALEIYESLLDPDSPEVGTAMYQLAILYQSWGKHVSAESMLNQALLVMESTYGTESEECLKVLEALITTYEKLEIPEFADSLRTRVHSISRTLEKNASKPKVADMFSSKVQELEELVEQSESVAVAQAMNKLAVIYAMLGDMENSLLLFGKSYDVLQRLVGERSYQAMVVLKNMATYFDNVNDLEKAAAFNQEVYEVLKELYPNGHDILAKTTILLARYYTGQDQLEEAAALQREVVAIKEKEYGVDHPSVAMELNNLAVLYCHLVEYSKALPLYERALSIYEEFYGPDHELALDTIANLAKLKQELDDSDHFIKEF